MPKHDRTRLAFGSNVLRLREAKEFSQEKLAEKANLDRTYIGEAVGLAVKKFLENARAMLPRRLDSNPIGTISTSSHFRAKRGEQREHPPQPARKIESHTVRRAVRENGTRWNASMNRSPALN